MEPSNPTKLDGNDTTTISHHPYILWCFANYVLCLLVVCIGGLWKAVGWVVLSLDPRPFWPQGLGSRLGIVLAWCGVHVDVHGK